MSADKQDQIREHVYDGIQEYDNRLPNWWLFILYASIVFAVGYWLVFHTFEVLDLPVAKYEKEMIAATEAQLARMAEMELTDDALNMMATVGSRVEQGRELFQTYCVVCHLGQGQGLVGPNLTDNFWIHGGAPLDIHAVITNGVLSKGMAAWGNQLGPTRVQSITAYVLTLRNTDVAGKAPEGDPYQETIP